MDQIAQERLRRWRTEKDLTQQALADILLVSQPAVAEWETGNGKPRLEKMLEIHRYTRGAVPWWSWIDSPADRQFARSITREVVA